MQLSIAVALQNSTMELKWSHSMLMAQCSFEGTPLAEMEEGCQETECIAHRAKAAGAQGPIGAVWAGTNGDSAGLHMPIQLQHA